MPSALLSERSSRPAIGVGRSIGRFHRRGRLSVFSLRRDPTNKSPRWTSDDISARRTSSRLASTRQVSSRASPAKAAKQPIRQSSLPGRTCRRCRSPGDAVAGQRPCRIPGEILANRPGITTTKVYALDGALDCATRVEYYIYARTSSLNRYNVDAVCISGFDYHPLFLHSSLFTCRSLAA